MKKLFLVYIIVSFAGIAVAGEFYFQRPEISGPPAPAMPGCYMMQENEKFPRPESYAGPTMPGAVRPQEDIDDFRSTYKYNFTVDKWEYIWWNARLHYNYYDKTLEYKGPRAKLEHNVMEDEWQFRKPGSRLRYYPVKKKWEFNK